MAGAAEFRRLRLSLAGLLGRDYVDSVLSAGGFLSGRGARELRRLAREEVDLFPAAVERRLAGLLAKVGQQVARPLGVSLCGALTERINEATKVARAPLAGFGYYRVGEDGRLYFLSKSEHYHTSVGHAFPGYRLLEIARTLGIPNATHNNTRGYITRLLEEELIRSANGPLPNSLPTGGGEGRRAAGGDVGRMVRTRRRGVLNRVLNLETGSLAAEAGLKLMLARFYRPQDDSPAPPYAGRVPVFIVLADDDGGPLANYHGTTIVAQMLRGMWPEMVAGMQAAAKGGLTIVPVRPNDVEGLEAAFARWDRGRYKVAGFVCELVLMNYGARRLTERYARRAQALCRQHDAPFMIDEIQTCMWSPQLFMFREYGLRPDIVAVGKGFPGGEYPASRVLFGAAFDALPQFGALVTNGQEEIASLAYLVTMRWAQANADLTAAIGAEYEERLRGLADRFPQVLAGIDGRRHMCALCFRSLDIARAFVQRLVAGGLDISVQSYKAICPPAALTKLPLIAGRQAVDLAVSRMEAALTAMREA